MSTVIIPLDLNDDNTGLSDLLITDAKLLIRPAVPGQYPSSARHDSGHAYSVLNLANDMGGMYEVHIVTNLNPDQAHRMLDRVFSVYIDICNTQLWCEADVTYKVDGQRAKHVEYGFDDSEYTLRIYVHCNVSDVEALIAKQMEDTTSDRPLIIVRPDDSPAGYTADKCFVDDAPAALTDPSDLEGGFGFHGEQLSDVTGGEEEDSWSDVDGPEDDEDNEDPLAGDIDDGSHYGSALHPFDAHRLSVMRQHGDYTG